MARSTNPKYRPDIDGLRAVAVLSVIGFHAFPSLAQSGFIGVDIFFVISGFLISTIIFENLEAGTFSYIEFYARRVRRIAPALIVVLLTCLTYGWVVLLRDEFERLGKHVFAGTTFISNFLLWNEAGYFDATSDTKPLLHLWSLGIEEQFYIFWPLLLGIVWKREMNFLMITVVVALSSFAFNIIEVHNDPVGAFYSPLTRVWELMVGGGLAYLKLHKPTVSNLYPHWQSAAGLMLLLVGFALIRPNTACPGVWALFPTMGAFLLISGGPTAWINHAVFANRAAVWVGLNLLSKSRPVRTGNLGNRYRPSACHDSDAVAAAP
jgi:peptidoglycan/LPS O-acetylase OafA/YrhL